MKLPAVVSWALFFLIVTPPVPAPAAEPVRVGLGSYTVDLPPGAKEPPPVLYKTDRVRGPMPTTDWWRSPAWVPFSMSQYPHPLAVQAAPAGLRVFYPGPGIAANPKGIFGGAVTAKTK